ncbi:MULTISPECIES: CPBP family intramembrane glutamic endopeptidase [Sporosarcina]|uniref:CPBP family intramembrane glutamic endopeptidase n=1 Tax=Sporosarcina TaxID=1569 RepID=UPI0006936B6B|nr:MULTISPECIES: CPBP family intramembrane glutamic endopeptidase [Sporosarcina]WJY27195.1 CPBP family intramembrane metalloprotease [Sporosarcina sp. 0.2-SM1T-5]
MTGKKPQPWILYLTILFLYIAMQFASLPVSKGLIQLFGKQGFSTEHAAFQGVAWGLFTVNILAILAFFLVIRTDKNFWTVFKAKKASVWMSMVWGVFGFFLALGGQMLAGAIEKVIGIENGSDNTMRLTEVSAVAPIMIVCIVLFAPILEEIVFRRVVFGGIYTKTNFWIAAIASALIFAAVHNEFQHILVYLMPGLVFSYVYYRTGRIWSSMISHLLMNSFVMVVTLNMDKILELQKLKEAVITLIGHLG